MKVNLQNQDEKQSGVFLFDNIIMQIVTGGITPEETVQLLTLIASTLWIDKFDYLKNLKEIEISNKIQLLWCSLKPSILKSKRNRKYYEKKQSNALQNFNPDEDELSVFKNFDLEDSNCIGDIETLEKQESVSNGPLNAKEGMFFEEYEINELNEEDMKNIKDIKELLKDVEDVTPYENFFKKLENISYPKLSGTTFDEYMASFDKEKTEKFVSENKINSNLLRRVYSYFMANSKDEAKNMNFKALKENTPKIEESSLKSQKSGKEAINNTEDGIALDGKLILDENFVFQKDEETRKIEEKLAEYPAEKFNQEFNQFYAKEKLLNWVLENKIDLLKFHEIFDREKKFKCFNCQSK